MIHNSNNILNPTDRVQLSVQTQKNNIPSQINRSQDIKQPQKTAPDQKVPVTPQNINQNFFNNKNVI